MKSKNKFQKMIATVVVGTILTSQIGCANRVTHTSLSNAAFDPKYSYTIKTNQNINFPNVSGAEIQNLPDRIYIKQNGETKYLLHNQITEIDGRSYEKTGSHALEGLGIGAGSGAVAGIVFVNFLISSFEDYECSHDCAATADERIQGSLLGAGFGIGIGGLIGLCAGAFVPKRSKVQITPTFSQTQTSTSAGANLSVKF